MSHASVRIYHNNRCSKSRAACQLIAEKGIDAEIVDYLKTPPSHEELRELLRKLGMRPSELVRRGEAVFKAHYAGRSLSEDEWLQALLTHPILIERPIVVSATRQCSVDRRRSVLELL